MCNVPLVSVGDLYGPPMDTKIHDSYVPDACITDAAPGPLEVTPNHLHVFSGGFPDTTGSHFQFLFMTSSCV